MNRLKELRVQYGLTQKELGEKIGFTQSHYASYERGETELTESIILKLISIYNVSSDYLLGLSSINIYTLEEIEAILIIKEKAEFLLSKYKNTI